LTWRPSGKLRAYLVLLGAGVVLSLLSARPEPVLLVAPFAIAVAGGLALTRRLDHSVSRALERDTAVEDDVVAVTVDVDARAAVPTLELVVELPPGCAAPIDVARTRTTLRAGEARSVPVPVTCERWGNYVLGQVRVRARSTLGLFVAVGTIGADLPLTVYPAAQTLRRLVDPLEPVAIAGNHVTRLRSSGSEFADLRPYVAGDRARDINWRASARHSSLWVEQRHPERSTDVVLLLDTYTELMLPEAVRVVYSLVDAYLAQRDRVGLVRFGGTLGWIRAGSGPRQRYVVVRELLAASVFASVARRGIEQIPAHMLPPRALVLAVSPLLDDRMSSLLPGLRARGLDLVVLEMSPASHAAPAPGPAGEAAFRLWVLERDVRRAAMREMGIPVVRCDAERPLASVLEEVRAWPRHARFLR
jgi:uncharacterized protein (DUF58 family)